jgi:uncharacterized metal-binding protein
MNFKGHSIGGVVTASSITGVAMFLGKLKELSLFEPNFLILWGITYGFSLYPDVDTKSTPQKIYFRILFVLCSFLIYFKMFEICSVVLLFSTLPLLFKHRGFTHWWLSALILPFLCFALFEFFVLGNVISEMFLLKYGWYIIGGTLGWLTHLVLDKV